MHTDIFAEETEKHLQVNDFYPECPEDCFSFWRGLQDRYEGYEVDFCYHNHEAPIAFLKEIGASLLESCVEARLTQENFTLVYGLEATLVSNGNLAEFVAMHDKVNHEMYWTGERISRDLSQWRIYMCGKAYVMMSIWGDIAEIFALEATNAKEGAALLSTVAAFAFETGKTAVLMMVDDNTPIQLEAARLVGFAECGRYRNYRGLVK